MKHIILLGMCAMMLMAGACSNNSSTSGSKEEATASAPKTAPEFQAGIVNELDDPTLLEPGTPVNKLTVVDFNAIWCGPCRQLTPVLEDLAEKYEDRVDFVSVDVDKFGDLMDAYNLGTSIPAVLILQPKGKPVSYIGISELIPEEKFEAILDNLLK